jgi:hypothetical protein
MSDAGKFLKLLNRAKPVIVGWLPLAVSAHVTRSTYQTHTTSGSWIAVSFSSAEWDYVPIGLSLQWASGTPTRLTCQVAGVYALTGNLYFDTSTVGIRGVGLRINGTTYISSSQTNALSSGGTYLSTAGVAALSIGDYVELVGLQSSGGALNMPVLSGAPSLTLTQIGRL